MPRVVPSQVLGLIDQVFPEAKTHDPAAPFKLRSKDAIVLAGIVRLVDSIPDELLRLSSKKYAEYLAAVEAIRQALATWPHEGTGPQLILEKVRGLYKMSPLLIIRTSLSQCPDDYPPPETTGLEFISDAELRENLRLDFTATERTLARHEFKAATVLAGSAIEALLLWALEQREQSAIAQALARAKASNWLKRNPPADDLLHVLWGLSEYRETAGELEIITQATRDYLRLVTDFRNLIHPARVKRLNTECNRGTAMAAAAGLEFVVNDLSRQHH